MNLRNVNIKFLTICILFICLSTGCAQNIEAEEDAEKWREQAELLAIEHIENKYGFTPTIIDCKSNHGDSVTPPNPYISQTIITMSADDKTFMVIADGDDNTTDRVLDNYQEGEIIDALKNYLSEYLQIPVYDITLRAGDSVKLPGKDFEIQYNFFHDFFDEKDIQDYLTQKAITAHIKLVGDIDLNEFSVLPKDSLIYHSKAEFLITTHESEEYADICFWDTYFDKSVYTCAMYMNDAVDIRNGKINEYELFIKKYNDIFYFCPDDENIEMSLKEDIVSASEWTQGSTEYQQISNNAYYVLGTTSNNSSDIYLYIPSDLFDENLHNINNYCLGEAYYKSEYNKFRYERHKGTSVNKYQVYETSSKNKEDISFRLLFITK